MNKFPSRYKHFLSRKCIWLCCLWNVSLFFLVLLCWLLTYIDAYIMKKKCTLSNLQYKTPNPNTWMFLVSFSVLCLCPIHWSQVSSWEWRYVVGAAPTGDAPTTSEWSAILLPTKVWLILGLRVICTYISADYIIVIFHILIYIIYIYLLWLFKVEILSDLGYVLRPLLLTWGNINPSMDK